jgi:transposase
MSSMLAGHSRAAIEMSRATRMHRNKLATTAWLGLVPRQYATGGTSILGRNSKRGSQFCGRIRITFAA